MRFAVIAHRLSETNVELAARGWPGACSMLLAPVSALRHLRPGDVALNRLDVLETLNGVEDGLWSLGRLEARGVRVLNSASALLAAHDKLLTARLLSSAGVPHPRTARLTNTRDARLLSFPVVAKPRFGSWGRDVKICLDEVSLQRYLAASLAKAWGRAGAIVQELVLPVGCDLRVIVAGGKVVGCTARRARAGEWRTSVALGAVVEPAVADRQATELALAATRIVGLDLAGVDLLPSGDGYVVIEVNGAVEFRKGYLPGGDVFDAAMSGLAAPAARRVLSVRG